MDPFSPQPSSSARGRADHARLDRRAAVLAAEQHGAISRSQLLALGCGDAWIRERVRRTLWPAGPSVYAFGHPRLSRRGRGIAALLHAGDGAALSYLTAARVWGIARQGTGGPIHVSVQDRRDLVAAGGVTVHRPRSLRAGDVVRHRGLWVTTPERTLIDLLPTMSVAQITGMLEQMITHLGRSPDDLHAWGTGLHRVSGKRKLLRALDEVAGPAVIRSEFEALFREVCREAGLPSPETNHHIGGREVDAAWVLQRVAVELDSWRWHGGRWQFHQDRRKGLIISRAGYELLRLTWAQLKHERAEVIETLRYAIQRGAWRRDFEATQPG